MIALPPLNAPAMPEGLSEGEARQQLLTDGPNELPVSRPRSMLRLVREVAFEPMFLLLVACGALYMALGDVKEALMLLGFVFVVMGIGSVRQRRSERSLDALRNLSSPQARVRRAGNERSVAARDLVVGDVVMLAEGDRVPADPSLTACANLAIDESSLTGESAPVSKQSDGSPRAAGDVAFAAPDAGLAHAFSGTLVTRGTAWGQVTTVGERSALGRIGQSLSGVRIESTPIQKETRRVVTRIAIIGLALAAALAITFGLLRGDWLHGSALRLATVRTTRSRCADIPRRVRTGHGDGERAARDQADALPVPPRRQAGLLRHEVSGDVQRTARQPRGLLEGFVRLLPRSDGRQRVLREREPASGRRT